MQLHSFHIPVMGIGYTIDSPIKVAQYGISSAISLVDDALCERMREFYSSKQSIPYQAISSKSEDSRAKRFTAYLNMVQVIVNARVDQFKTLLVQKQSELEKFIALLPSSSDLGEKLKIALDQASPGHLQELIERYLTPGSIDVNIMTKLDKENYQGDEKLPVEFNDAHAALRGFALSNLSSSLVLSAGMSPRLYAYLEKFDDFYPNEQHQFRKKITLKVSDYRSAIVQGKYLAKKGLWVSEFRVESGLNCGGHTFATQGFLMGPILAEFSTNRETLHQELFEIYAKGLEAKNKPIPTVAPDMKVTAQGGVGTAEEHTFLINHYHLDSVGWGSPFLLVPEAASIDQATIDLLARAEEKDFYLSETSPVGVPFNNVRGNTKDQEKLEKISQGNPGAACTKKFLVLNTDAEGKPICTGSRKYQKTKIEELKTKGLSQEEYQHEYFRITDKACICNGLGSAALLAHSLDTVKEGAGVTVCAGPNLAYFTKESSLHEMVDHIYGRINLISHPNRPNLFVKELNMYLDYIANQFNETRFTPATVKTMDGWREYLTNLDSAIAYYQSLFAEQPGWNSDTRVKTLEHLKTSKKQLDQLFVRLDGLKKQEPVLA